MENFIKETEIVDLNSKERKKELMQSILKAKAELVHAHNNFEYAEDELIDYYSYQIKAIQSKLDYLLKVAKDKNLILNLDAS